MLHNVVINITVPIVVIVLIPGSGTLWLKMTKKIQKVALDLIIADHMNDFWRVKYDFANGINAK